MPEISAILLALWDRLSEDAKQELREHLIREAGE